MSRKKVYALGVLVFILVAGIALGLVFLKSAARSELILEIEEGLRKGRLVRVRRTLEKYPSLVHTRDPYGWTPLHVSCVRGGKEIAELLIEYGAAVNATAYSDRPVPYKQPSFGQAIENAFYTGKDLGNTPLHIATRWYYHKDVAQVLIRHGADVNATNACGNTPIYSAVSMNDREMVKLLLEAGADLNVTNKQGSTPLHVAASAGYNDMVALMLQKGADATVKDSEGRTPLSIAEGKGNKQVADLLKATEGQK